MRDFRKRTNYFIDKDFQVKFIALFCLIVLISSVLITVLLLYLSRDSNTVAIENTRVIVKRTADFIFPITLQTVLIVLVFSGVAVIMLTLIVSHKIAGPLYRLTKEIDALEDGDLTRQFKTRGTDQLQAFSENLFRMSSILRSHCAQIKGNFNELKIFLGKRTGLSPEDAKEQERLLGRLEENLNKFKTS